VSDKKPTDQKAVISSFNQLVRDEHSRHRVQVTAATSRDDLNDALRIAAGRGPQHAEAEPAPQSFPWKSLETQSNERGT
jgi:hypothetical protein